MTKAFTVIELLIVVAIIATLVSLASATLTDRHLKAGNTAMVKATRQEVVIVTVDDRTTPTTFIVRIDNGSKASPRYSEARFTRHELAPAGQKVER